ncbi:MAG TPA: AAC(3) family N-acetyltransferase [Flavobacteriales bacterium]|nr:AAC(3) family N-acetyltransferase [Flavobacteriales bacterium]
MSSTLPLSEWPTRIGLERGQNVLLAVDVTRLAWKHRREGAAKVPGLLLDAFHAALGPEATILVPTFNHDLQDGERYDPDRTGPVTGTLAAIACRHPGFQRTRHPLHSFAVAGGAQDRFMALDDASSFSLHSPFALMHELAFTVVVIDLDFDHAFSYFHHVEELERVPYRQWRDYAIDYGSVGGHDRRPFKLFAKRWGYANRLRDLQPLLEAAGAFRSMEVDGSTVIRVDISKAHPVIVKDIRENRARSIVHFTWRNWVRDAVRAILPMRPSRSATQLANVDAGPR